MSERYMTLSSSGLELFIEALDGVSIVANVVDSFGSHFDIEEFNDVFGECSDILYGSGKGNYVYSDERVVNAISEAWRMVGEADALADRVKTTNLFEITSYIDDEVRKNNERLSSYLFDFADGYMTFVYQRSQLLSDAYHLSLMAEELDDLGKADSSITVWVD